MPSTDFSLELYDLYALGVLESDEAGEIDDHLRTNCVSCMEQVRESLERAASLALAVPSVAPPGRLRTRIVGSVTPERSGSWAFLRSPGLAWTMAAICLVVGASLRWYLAVPDVRVSQAPATIVINPVLNAAKQEARAPVPDVKLQATVLALNAEVAQQRGRVSQLEAQLRVPQSTQARNQTPSQPPRDDGDQLPAVQRQLAAAQQRVDDLTHQVQFYQTAIQSQRGQIDRNVQLVSLLSSPTLRVLDLRATEQGGSASARALLSGNAQILFYASKLPALPAGRTYQLWLMRDHGRPVVSGGIFQPDSNQRAMLTVPSATSIADITALAVTEEPAGGQPLPTGHKILIGLAKT